jgi:hypothetical protein
MNTETFWLKIRNVQGIYKHLYSTGKGWIIGKFILLLMHTGRKSGTHYCPADPGRRLYITLQEQGVTPDD